MSSHVGIGSPRHARAGEDPAGFLRGLPRAIARQPRKFAGELREIFRH